MAAFACICFAALQLDRGNVTAQDHQQKEPLTHVNYRFPMLFRMECSRISASQLQPVSGSIHRDCNSMLICIR